MRAGDVVDGRFEVVEQVGAGGMGEVFRVIDRQRGEQAALKVLLRAGASAWTKISREAHVLSMMNVPGIVRYIGHGLTETGAPYLAMQWIEGETLEERLSRGPLSPEEALFLVKRMAHALGAVHALGLVHRDLKPANIMLPGGHLREVMLIDFGIARDALPLEIPLRGAEMSESLTGTPGYMAPEQVQGIVDMDARIDVFALGCIFYECLTGKPAFSAGDLLSLLARVVLEEPPRLRELCPDLPPAVETLCERMMSKRREERPRDGMQLYELLHHSIAWEKVEAAPLEQGSRGLSSAERQRMALILVQERKPELDETLQMTLSEAENTELINTLRRELAGYGAQLALVQAGWLLIVLRGGQSAGELSVRAFRSALLVREKLRQAAIFVATGRAEVAGRLPVGEFINQIADMAFQGLNPLHPRAIRVDEASAGLTGNRFLIERALGALWLIGEREEPRMLQENKPVLLGRTLPCFGRETELQALSSELLRSLKDEQRAGAALITGGAGLGKSRLLYETLNGLEREQSGIQQWKARGDPMGAGSAFGLVNQALRATVGIREGEPKPKQLRALEERVHRHEGLSSKRVAMFLGEMLGLGASDESDPQLLAARRNTMLMGDRIREAWEEFVRAECSVQPLIVVLEDLHWGDVPTVNLMGAALRYAKDLPFFVLAAGRPEVHSLFPAIWEEHCPHLLSLQPLKKEAGLALCKAALGDRIEPELLLRMVDRADGNPFFLEEQIREAAHGRGNKLPETILSTVQARLDACSVESRRILRAGSVFGETFWKGGVEHLLGEIDFGVEHELGELVKQEILVWTGAGRIEGQEEYRFRHSLLREAAYGLLTERDRRVGHGLAGHWLEMVGETDTRSLAEHFSVGGMPSLACALWLQAAKEALRGNDLHGAVERAERGVLCGPDGQILGALRRVQAEAHIWKGEYELAETRGMEALERLEEGCAAWFEAAIQVGWALERRGKYPPLEVLAERISGASPSDGTMAVKAMALAEIASTLVFCGNTKKAHPLLGLFDQYISQASEIGGDVMARRTQAEGYCHTISGYGELGVPHFKESACFFEKSGDARNACSAHNNIGFNLLELGDFVVAVSELELALLAAERMGLSDLVAGTHQNLGLAYLFLGKRQESLLYLERGLQLAQKLGYGRAIGLALIYLARAYLTWAEPETALRYANDARVTLQSAPALKPYALAVHATALLALGQADKALADARDAYDCLETQPVDEGLAFIQVSYAEALIANHQPDMAQCVLSKARDEIVSRANSFQDPKRREQFLHAVPEHNRILMLTEQLDTKN